MISAQIIYTPWNDLGGWGFDPRSIYVRFVVEKVAL